MISFHRFLEIINENAQNGHEFMQAVGEARQKLAEMHTTLQRNKDPQYQKGLVNYMKQARAQLSQILMPFDRQPVLGNGVEFRMQNQAALQQLVVDNKMGRDQLEDSIVNGKIDQVIQTVVQAEKNLGDMFRSFSGRRENPSMIS
ncbi:hypothetical protein EBT16_05520 [bacterium]|nr:hypothetical protein [bacterium]